MPSITISGESMHYQLHGRGFPILLGHSYLWDATMWQPQIEALSRRYQVIVPDLWGHGRSGPLPDQVRSLGDLAAQMSALLDALGIEACAVVGLSVGGMWGAELALREPERIRSLVMMDSGMDVEPEATRLRYFGMLDTIEALGSIPPPMREAIVPLFFRAGAALGEGVPAAFRRSLEGLSSERLRRSIVPLGRLIFGRPNALSRLSALDSERTLLMCGADDIARPPGETLEMARIIGCAHRLVPDAGHISNLENPDFVSAVLLEWLGRQLDAVSNA